MLMPQASPRQRALLALILGGYALLAVVYSLVTPLFEASDELWHYPMVQYVADHDFGLPAQDPASPGPWRQEGGQPPLYYYLGALLTRWIDTSDMEALRRINPHPDIGVVVPDGNANMVVHDAGRESFPWRGTALAMHLARFLSVLMGLGTVLLTYALGRELFPATPAIALAAAAFTAFNPMFLFISGVINSDNPSTPADQAQCHPTAIAHVHLARRAGRAGNAGQVPDRLHAAAHRPCAAGDLPARPRLAPARPRRADLRRADGAHRRLVVLA